MDAMNINTNTRQKANPREEPTPSPQPANVRSKPPETVYTAEMMKPMMLVTIMLGGSTARFILDNQESVL